MEVICEIEECIWCSNKGYCTNNQIDIDINGKCVDESYEED